MNRNKSVFYLSCISWMAFVMAISIALPIVFRPFYYAHIKAYDLANYSGYTEEQVKEAYDDMLDFCLFGGEFKTGEMKWSESGKRHFEDVGKLFHIDFIVLAIGAVGIIVTSLIDRGKKPFTVKGHTSVYWAAVCTLTLFVMLAVLGSINFSRFFVLFHKVFFPGKTNWIFYPSEDEIINVLPEEYFRNCAIAIVVILVILTVTMIVTEKKRLRRLEA